MKREQLLQISVTLDTGTFLTDKINIYVIDASGVIKLPTRRRQLLFFVLLHFSMATISQNNVPRLLENQIKR